MLVIIAFIFYFNTGNKNLLFGSMIAFLVFLSTHLSYRYTGSLQSALRNSIFIAIVVCAFVYLCMVINIEQKYPMMFVFLYTYMVALFSFPVFRPPIIDNHLKKLGILKGMIVTVLPIIVICGIIVFSTLGIIAGMMIMTPALLIFVILIIIFTFLEKYLKK